MEEIKGMIFEKKYYEKIRHFEPEKKLKAIETVLKHCFYGVEPSNEDPEVKAFFEEIKDELEHN